MTTYSINDGHDNQITTGLQEHEWERVAQEIADERGETVYVSPSVPGTFDAEAEHDYAEVSPRRSEATDSPRRED